MARFACTRAEVEKTRAEVAIDGNDKIRVLDIASVAHCFRTRDGPLRKGFSLPPIALHMYINLTEGQLSQCACL